MDIESLINEKIEADTTFQETLATLSDEERQTALETKRKEVIANEMEERVKEANKAKELAENYKVRAEKAERERKNTAPTNENPLSPKDYLALTEHKVSSDDYDEVMRLSKVLGKSVSETLQDGVTKLILKTRQEERATALATQTKGANVSRDNSHEAVLRKTQKGELPESDEDIQKLAEARMQERLKR